MKAKTLLISMFAITGIVAMAQRATMELTFTAVNNAVHVQMDSIKVMNRTQDCDTVLSWPDTVLAIEYIGLSENICQYDLFKVFQNHPNPALFETMVTLFMPEPGKVNLMVTDLSGRLVIKSEASLVKGYNLFNFLPGTSPVYIFTAQYNESIGTIKILNQLYRSGGNCSLKYMGSFSSGPALKTECLSGAFKLNQGDTLLLIGYSGSLQSGLLEIPITSQTYQFQFAYNIQCPDSPTITYEGQMYNTVQILSQCWLKENLNIGIMIPDNMESSDNGSIEKYCYDDDENNCIIYGGLYKYDEMMQYAIVEGGRGICPPGWHVPTDDEWKILEGAADSQYGISDPVWDLAYGRGSDVGTNLKASAGWDNNGNGTDWFGFSGLPGGHRWMDGGTFHGIGLQGFWWTSTEGFPTSIWRRYLYSDFQDIDRYYGYDIGFSVRCIRD